MPKVNCSVTVFTMDGASLLCQIDEATLSIENATEEGGCINDVWSLPVITGKDWNVSASGAVDTSNVFLLKALSDPTVTLVLTVAGGSWGGTALLTSATGTHARRSLDKGSATFTGAGALVWTAAV